MDNMGDNSSLGRGSTIILLRNNISFTGDNVSSDVNFLDIRWELSLSSLTPSNSGTNHPINITPYG